MAVSAARNINCNYHKYSMFNIEFTPMTKKEGWKKKKKGFGGYFSKAEWGTLLSEGLGGGKFAEGLVFSRATMFFYEHVISVQHCY